ETSRCTSTLPRPRRCARPATWKSPESSASRSHSRAGAIAANSSRRSSDSNGVALELEQAALVADSVRAVGAQARGPDDTMAGNEKAEAVSRAEAAGRAGGPRRPRERGELAVGDGLPAGDGPERGRTAVEERSLVVEVDRHVLQRHELTGEIRLEQP